MVQASPAQESPAQQLKGDIPNAPLEALKNHMDVAPGDVAQWWPWQC